MKYSKELHERVRQNLRMFDYPRFDDGDIDCLLDEIERLQAERRWTPVSERLIPGEGEVVLGYVDKSHLPTMVMFFEGEFVLVKSNKAPYERITHWMPLPQPPEEERC